MTDKEIKPEYDYWVKQQLLKAPFVQWDRFHMVGGYAMSVFGWIERDKDAYKDFVVIDLHLHSRQVKSMTTSSARYSQKLTELYDLAGHTKCQRVEDYYNIPNMVCLE